MKKWPFQIDKSQSCNEKISEEFVLFRPSGCLAALTFIEWRHTTLFEEGKLPSLGAPWGDNYEKGGDSVD